jgi:hypothetical protein
MFMWYLWIWQLFYKKKVYLQVFLQSNRASPGPSLIRFKTPNLKYELSDFDCTLFRKFTRLWASSRHGGSMKVLRVFGKFTKPLTDPPRGRLFGGGGVHPGWG